MFQQWHGAQSCLVAQWRSAIVITMHFDTRITKRRRAVKWDLRLSSLNTATKITWWNFLEWVKTIQSCGTGRASVTRRIDIRMCAVCCISKKGNSGIIWEAQSAQKQSHFVWIPFLRMLSDVFGFSKVDQRNEVQTRWSHRILVPRILFPHYCRWKSTRACTSNFGHLQCLRKILINCGCKMLLRHI